METSKRQKNVLLLSTIEPLLGVTNDNDKSKPSLHKLYGFTKGGTDIVNQKIGSYTVKAKSRKWTMVALLYLLDTISVNTCPLFALSKGVDSKKVNSFDFRYQLAEKLVMPAIEQQSRNGLSSNVVQKIKMVCPKAVLNRWINKPTRWEDIKCACRVSQELTTI